jgi:hypothetical protein
MSPAAVASRGRQPHDLWGDPRVLAIIERHGLPVQPTPRFRVNGDRRPRPSTLDGTAVGTRANGCAARTCRQPAMAFNGCEQPHGSRRETADSRRRQARESAPRRGRLMGPEADDLRLRTLSTGSGPGARRRSGPCARLVRRPQWPHVHIPTPTRNLVRLAGRARSSMDTAGRLALLGCAVSSEAQREVIDDP